MNRVDRLRQVLGLEALAAAAKAKAAEHRAVLQEDARAELEREGMAPTWRMPEIATVTLPVSGETAIVKDGVAFLAWCKDRYPDKVETVEQVRGAFVAALMAHVLMADGAVIDPDTGEVIPGVGVSPGGVPRALTIKVAPDTKAVFRAVGERLVEDLLAGPLQLTGPPEPAAVPNGEPDA